MTPFQFFFSQMSSNNGRGTVSVAVPEFSQEGYKIKFDLKSLDFEKTLYDRSHVFFS